MEKIAVIGAGYWGSNLVRNYHQIGVLQTVCDLRNEILNTITQSYPDVRSTHNYEDLFSDKAVQGIVIALPAEHHHEFTRRALEAGRDVFVGKPLV